MRALRQRGIRVSRKRVERLMRTLELSGLVPKRYRRTTSRLNQGGELPLPSARISAGSR